MKTNITLTLVILGAALLSSNLTAKETKEDIENFVPYDHAIDIFKGKENIDHPNVRIPTILNANGLIIAAAEGRHSAADQAQNDIVVSVSKDFGKTWSKPVIAACAKDSMEGSTFNNPCLLYDKDKKQILIFFQRYAPGAGERQSPPQGWTDEKCVRNFVTTSKDGKHWSKPKEVTRTTKHEDAALTCSGPNPGVQLTRGTHKGRLVVVFNEAVKFNDWVITAAFSDNHGKTWKIGEKSEGNKQINEVSWVETDKGGILVVARSYPGAGTRRVATSDDGGKSWSEVKGHPELPCTGCQNGLTRYSFKDDQERGRKSRILFTAPSTRRENGIIKMSYDNGKTWPVAKDFGKGQFAYSAVCPLEPGYFGVIFEPNDTKTIRFVRVPMAWLTDGEDTGIGKRVEKKEKNGKVPEQEQEPETES